MNPMGPGVEDRLLDDLLLDALVLLLRHAVAQTNGRVGEALGYVGHDEIGLVGDGRTANPYRLWLGHSRW